MYIYKVIFAAPVHVEIFILDRLLSGKVHWSGDERPPLMPPYCLEMNISSLSFRPSKKGDGFVEVQGSFTATFDPFNCFIFCMSLDNGSRETPFSDYDSKWSIPIERCAAFSERLAQEIKVKLDFTNLIPLAPKIIGPGSLNDVSVESIHRAISYESRDTILSHVSIFDLVNLGAKINSAPFIKPRAPYEREAEYRFAHEIKFGTGLVPPGEVGIDLPFERFFEFIVLS